MKNLTRLKGINEESPYFGISLSHDMTEDERNNNKKSFQEAKPTSSMKSRENTTT